MTADNADSLDELFTGSPDDPGVVYLAVGESAFQSDFTEDEASYEWLLAARSGTSELGISWSAPELPEDKLLTLVAVDSELRPVGEAAIPMQSSSGLTVSANTERRYRVIYGSHTAVVLSLQKGWNLISLPIAPLHGDVDDVLRDPVTQMPVNQGLVTKLVNGRNQLAETIEPLRGYWIYMTTPYYLLIEGVPLPSSEETIAFPSGWHMYGPADEISIPANLPIIRAWDGKRYVIPHAPLHPTHAYYFLIAAPNTSVNLGK
jgi:hypothetical protein